MRDYISPAAFWAILAVLAVAWAAIRINVRRKP